MSEPIWVSLEVLLEIHDEQLQEHGGSAGIRDRNLLESALARPKNQYVYSESSLPELAAAYAFGIARNHPFVDGNKRTAFIAMALFLWTNGFRLVTTQTEAIAAMLELASGTLPEAALALWVRDRVVSEPFPPSES